MIDSAVKTKTGKENIKAYEHCDDIPFPILHFKELQRNHKIYKYATEYITLDTETSKKGVIDKDTGEYTVLNGWVYQWAMKLHNTYIYGRKPSQIIDTMTRIAEHYKLTDKKRILIFIHNMPYDYQYLKWYFAQYDPTMQVFAIDNHHTIKIDL